MEKQGFNNDTLNSDVHKRSAIEDHNFKVLFDYAPQGMMTVDKDYKIVNINTTAAQIFSVSAEQSIGKTIGCSFGCVNFNKNVGKCNGSEACSFCVFKNSVDNVLFNGGKVNGIEFPFECRAAEEDYQCWLKLTAVPMMLNNALHALLVIDDVTVNKELAKNLIRNEKRLRLVMDNMIDMITQINHKGEIEFVTSSCWSMLGYSPDELINKIFTDYVFPEDLLMVKSLFQKRFRTRENFSTRLRLLNRTQEVVWVEANGSVVDDENRRRTIVYVIRDVTEEERYKRELEKSKEAAISASKSKSEFLANMSHEIRTPMNGIIGMTNITLMDRLTKEQRENLTMVKNSAISLLGIINSILDFSKIEAGKIEIEKVEFDIKDLVSKTVNPLIISADQKGIELEVNYDLHMHRKLIGDPVRISQIMNNIIYNAIKFTKKGGVYANFGTVDLKNNMIELRCSVRDTGIGISKEDQEQLFESFHQVDGSITRKYGGTGLGLSITKGLVDLMDGTLEVESELGKGSVFGFTLPLKVSSIQQVIKHNQVEITLPIIDRQLKVLLVEDDLVNRKMTKKILENQNHRVFIAKNGKEAVACCSEDNFDLILMDIQMPEMDGIKASKIIKKIDKERNSYTPIIALTAYAIAGDEERFIKEGMDDYISKPIELTKFFDVIMRNIDKEKPLKNSGDDEIEDILKRVKHNKGHEHRKLSNDNQADLDFFGRILKFFRTIDRGLREHDFEAIETSAHRLKNIFSEMGYLEERKVVFKLELAARRNDLEKILAEYSELKKCFSFEE